MKLEIPRGRKRNKQPINISDLINQQFSSLSKSIKDKHKTFTKSQTKSTSKTKYIPPIKLSSKERTVKSPQMREYIDDQWYTHKVKDIEKKINKVKADIPKPIKFENIILTKEIAGKEILFDTVYAKTSHSIEDTSKTKRINSAKSTKQTENSSKKKKIELNMSVNKNYCKLVDYFKKISVLKKPFNFHKGDKKEPSFLFEKLESKEFNTLMNSFETEKDYKPVKEKDDKIVLKKIKLNVRNPPIPYPNQYEKTRMIKFTKTMNEVSIIKNINSPETLYQRKVKKLKEINDKSFSIQKRLFETNYQNTSYVIPSLEDTIDTFKNINTEM